MLTETQEGLSQLQNEFQDALLSTERHTATRLILDAVDAGISIKDIYLQVFQTTQREIGRLWQANEVSIAQEHYCTAVTQSIMSQLYPHIFSTKKRDRRLVATCVGGELHEIGIRMVADFFEMEGWDTYYLGANMPAESLIQSISEVKADILAISVSMTFNVSKLIDLINKIRASEIAGGTKILVGGRPFIISENLWRNVKADATAPDAQAAIGVAESLLDSDSKNGVDNV